MCPIRPGYLGAESRRRQGETRSALLARGNMMNDHIQMSLAKAHQEDLLARSVRRQLAKAAKCGAKARGKAARTAALRTCSADLG